MSSPTILIGDVRERIAEIPDGSVQCVVTSPPYYGLRDYGHDGQIGHEPTPQAYVDEMVDVFREVRRVLADDGVLWLNIGDSYAGAGAGGGGNRKGNEHGQHDAMATSTIRGKVPVGLKEKDLIGIPWRVAFALQADGWYLRQDVIWSKPNPMPESIKDRCTKSHEYLFLLTKSPRYYYNAEPVMEDAVTTTASKFTDGGSDKQRGHGRRHAGFNGRYAEKIAKNGVPTKRNRRSVWTIATRPYKGAHFAVMPEALVEPCILAGTKEGGTVLDPFAGSGTVLRVAQRLGRQSIGIELNPDYLPLIKERTMQSSLMMGGFNE